MANWKKVIVSGSTAALAAANVDGTVTANAFSGDGSSLTNVPAGSINIESFTDGTGITVVGTDKLILSDGGTEKYVEVGQLFDSSDFDTEVAANTAVTANTAKTGITSGQASAITANTAKTGITSGQASAITANTAKATNVTTDLSVGTTSTQIKVASSDGDDAILTAATDSAAGIMTSTMFEAFEVNKAKVGITTGQASAITANTAKTGITSGQASAITANTAKNTNVSTDLSISGTTGARTIVSSDGNNAIIPLATTSVSGLLSPGLFDEIDANTSKTGITSGQASAITANTAKTGITSGQASAITANTAKTGITSGQASAITANTAKLGVTEANLVEVLNRDLGGNFIIGNQNNDTASFKGPVTVEQALTVNKDLAVEGGITVTGNLDVNGTVTTVDTTNLAVADKFIELNRGASSNGDGGIVINGAANRAFGWDDSADRWAFDFTGASATQTAITSDAFVAAVVTTDDTNYRKNGNIRIDSGDIYIYTE